MNELNVTAKFMKEYIFAHERFKQRRKKKEGKKERRKDKKGKIVKRIKREIRNSKEEVHLVSYVDLICSNIREKSFVSV